MTTLNDVFGLSGQDYKKRVLRHARQQADLNAAADEAHGAGKDKMWRRFIERQCERLPELLDLDLARIIAHAWKKHQDLRKYADKSRDKPNEPVEVALVDHRIRSKHRPHIDVFVNEVKRAELRFDVSLTLTLKGLELIIRDGRIVALRAGSCKGEGELKMGGFRIAKRRTSKIELGQQISLAEGIPVG